MYKHKYGEYKQKLRQANSSIQTLAERIAKYELQMAAEKDIESNRGARRGGQYSSQGVVSDGDEELNEEIRKLLEENRRNNMLKH